MAKSSKRRTSKPPKNAKPPKPYDGFPLTPHPNGQWCKKRKGVQFYFGSWSDWEGALEEYNEDWPFILKHGRRPTDYDRDDTRSDTRSAATVGDLCDRFIESKRTKYECDELSLRSLKEYEQATKRIIAHFGRDRILEQISTSEFEKFRAFLIGPKGERTPVTWGKYIRLSAMVFKYAETANVIEGRLRLGDSMKEPPKRKLRLHRQSRDKRMFEAEEIRRILEAANPVMRAMVLLATNCGFGNSDLANLPKSAIDFDSGWVDFPRSKTGIERRIPLWPETIQALREAIEIRPNAKGIADDGLCFLTRLGKRWVRHTGNGAWLDSVGGEFKKLLKSLDINGNRGFYSLRHVCQTIGDDAKDPIATKAVMGHVDDSMSGEYREGVSDERLRAVVGTVRNWLQPAKALSKQPAE